MGESVFAGKTIEFKADNGAVYHNIYSADGTTLHYEAVEGLAEGASEEVRLRTAEVAPGVHMVSWTESSGITVSQAVNFNAGTIHSFWSRDAGGRRVGELQSGSFAVID
ncbi:phenolic acid decarboxylase [Glycomyces xiaoerkulensis]|uniref:phenolic acid decarboxylase n=1 Tax=Glycomyces xiaoerkulensis TaxID=2038139 RepID=UPI000C25906D|nr:phenolic acid decarboxylase [Glycomyces xiaoerkulensis]